MVVVTKLASRYLETTAKLSRSANMFGRHKNPDTKDLGGMSLPFDENASNRDAYSESVIRTNLKSRGFTKLLAQSFEQL